MQPFHTFRTLILDDQWRDWPSGNHVATVLESVFSVESSRPQHRGPRQRLRFTLNAAGSIRAGLILRDYPTNCLENTDHGLRWIYGDDSWPVGVQWATSDLGAQVCEWSKDSMPAGFYVGVELEEPSEAAKYGGRYEIFGLSFWPFDRLDDLIGCRDGNARFWNLLILDNLIYRNEVEKCQLTLDVAAPDPFGGRDRLFLFDHFRQPVSDPNRDALWDPDRRTQAIVEASQETNYARQIASRKLWPRFQLDKATLARDSRDAAVKEFRTYQDCRGPSPAALTWDNFVTSIAALEANVKKWHEPPIDSLQDCDGVAARVAATDFPVFFVGAPGTGKTHLAKAIHKMSSREQGKFEEVNCGAIPREGNFFESTMFGMVKGALWKDSPPQEGVFELAHKGTVFLDEVHHLPERLQAALLTFLEKGEIRRLGEAKLTTLDIRIIAATNEPDVISRAFEDPTNSRLRPDFIQRLAFHCIELPNLSERSVEEFVKVCENVFAEAKAHLSSEKGLPPEVDPIATERIKAIRIERAELNKLYRKVSDSKEWKRQFDIGGNVRFLKQLMTKAIIRQWTQDEITLRHIEQAYESEKLRPSPEPSSPYRAKDTVVQATRVLDAFRTCVKNLTDSLTLEDIEIDATATRALVELWCLPPTFPGMQPPPFIDWVEHPEKIQLGDASLSTIDRNSLAKWKLVTIFALLRFLRVQNIEKLSDSRIDKVFKNPRYAEQIKPVIDGVFTRLGYEKASGPAHSKQSPVPSLLSVWETEVPMRSGFPYVPGTSANKAYVDALIERLR